MQLRIWNESNEFVVTEEETFSYLYRIGEQIKIEYPGTNFEVVED